MAMPPTPTPDSMPPVKKPAGLVWAGVTVFVLSIVVFALSMVLIVRVAGLDGEDFEVPGSQSFRLENGTYAVWLSNGSSFGNQVITADIEVTGPNGESVTVRRPSVTQTTDEGGSTYIVRGEFEVRASGTYLVEVDSDEAEVFRVGPPLSVGGIVGGVLGIFGSMALFLVALVLFIVGLVKRSKAGRPPAYGPPAGPPGGYGPAGYPQPQGYPQQGYQQPQGYGPQSYPPPGGDAPPSLGHPQPQGHPQQGYPQPQSYGPPSYPPPTGPPAPPAYPPGQPGPWNPPGDERS
jgi:hypothetical protein